MNVVMSNEAQADWIAGLFQYMRSTGLKRVHASEQAQDGWAETVKGAVRSSVLADSKSWYVGANVPGKAKGILAYAGGIANYLRILDECAADRYAGLVSRPMSPALSVLARVPQPQHIDG